MAIRRFAFVLSAITVPRIAVAQRIIVGPDVRVDVHNDGRLSFEYYSAAHPTDPNRLAVGLGSHSPNLPRRWSVLYTSTDGGKNWQYRAPLSRELMTDANDNAVAFGFGDTLYFSVNAYHPTAFR